jgi:hypothetical protein
LIVQISPSTYGRDRLEKLVAYQKLDSLRECALLTEEKVSVEMYRRSSDGWEIETFAPGDIV